MVRSIENEMKGGVEVIILNFKNILEMLIKLVKYALLIEKGLDIPFFRSPIKSFYWCSLRKGLNLKTTSFGFGIWKFVKFSSVRKRLD